MSKREPVKADNDPSWAAICKPLLLFLREKPRDLAELTVWRKDQRVSHTMLVHMISWCENRRIVFYHARKWALITTGARLPASRIEHTPLVPRQGHDPARSRKRPENEPSGRPQRHRRDAVQRGPHPRVRAPARRQDCSDARWVRGASAENGVALMAAVALDAVLTADSSASLSLLNLVPLSVSVSDGAVISIAPGVIVDYLGTPSGPTPFPTRVLPGVVASVPGPGTYTRPLPATRGSYRVSFEMRTPPLGVGLFHAVLVGIRTIDASYVHVLETRDTGAIVAEGGSIAPDYICSSVAPVLDGTIVTVTFAWDGQNLLDNGHHVKMKIDGGPDSTVVFETPWTSSPLTDLYVGDATAIAPVSVYPGWIGRVQWSGRTDV